MTMSRPQRGGGRSRLGRQGLRNGGLNFLWQLPRVSSWLILVVSILVGGCRGCWTQYTLEDPNVAALDGRAGESLVYRVDVPAGPAWWLTIALKDTLAPYGPESGLDVDAI